MLNEVPKDGAEGASSSNYILEELLKPATVDCILL